MGFVVGKRQYVSHVYTLRTGEADLRFALQLCKTDDANLRF